MSKQNLNPATSFSDSLSDPDLNVFESDGNLNETGIDAYDLKKEVEQLITENTQANENKGLLLVRKVNKCIEIAKGKPIPQMLFSELWFEGELCYLFSDANLGKSILAVQIGNSITKGEHIPGFKLEAQPQPVLYFDFELSDKQLEGRYSENYEQHYVFNDNFFRAEINPDVEIPEGYPTFENYLNQSIERSIMETRARILIIDNITYLKNENEKAKDALPLMKHLKGLKNKYQLSILALAHTPKRDLTKPITRNDLQGSKMLMNFCDSAFAIGESCNDKNIRYLKQIKVRNTELIYDSENVCICQIEKPNNFLMFDFIGFGSEREHLRQPSEEDKETLKTRIIELHQQGRSLRQIGAELGISHMKVGRILHESNNLYYL